ncbi:dCTP deaminase [Candidatus Micrarchaeota archaeon]|nr:dCTP deaminase [Candidatus Micrarchaeota archaeon]
MTALSDVDIKRLMRSGKIRIKPLKEEQIGSASIDLTLGNEWYFFKDEYRGTLVDLKKVDFKKAHRMIKAKTVILAPGEICLGKTIEKITLAPDIMGKLEGRSRYARMGLSIHITSSIVQPGSDNHQVLEIVNLAPFSVALHSGMRVSQVVFEELKTPTSRPYSKYGKIAKVQ